MGLYHVRMPTNLIRYQETGNLHFITFSCYHRRPYLGSPDARTLFQSSLESMRLRYDFFVTGYVVMPEHVHLLISEPTHAILAKALQALKLSVAVKRKERTFWQARYYDFNVYTEKKRVEKLRYIHRNPVTRGLVAAPDHYRISLDGRAKRAYSLRNPRLKSETWGTHFGTDTVRCGPPAKRPGAIPAFAVTA